MSPFKIRQRLRSLLGREPGAASDPIPPVPRPAPTVVKPTVNVGMHGAGEAEPAPVAPAKTPAATPAAAPTAAVAPTAAKAVPEVVKETSPASATAATAATATATADAELDPEAAAKKAASDKEKQAKHWKKTRKGMLKWLTDQGGSGNMKEMHDYSERKFFVAHRGFSNLMSEFTDEGLVNYTGATGLVELTEAGKAAQG